MKYSPRNFQNLWNVNIVHTIVCKEREKLNVVFRIISRKLINQINAKTMQNLPKIVVAKFWRKKIYRKKSAKTIAATFTCAKKKCGIPCSESSAFEVFPKHFFSRNFRFLFRENISFFPLTDKSELSRKFSANYPFRWKRTKFLERTKYFVKSYVVQKKNKRWWNKMDCSEK